MCRSQDGSPCSHLIHRERRARFFGEADPHFVDKLTKRVKKKRPRFLGGVHFNLARYGAAYFFFLAGAFFAAFFAAFLVAFFIESILPNVKICNL
jgi:hypothetical protein